MALVKTPSPLQSRSSFLLWIGLTVAGLFSAPAISAKQPSSKDVAEARSYVLAVCIVNQYKGEPLALEADAWAAGLVENGHFAAATYVALSDLARTAPPAGVSREGIVMRLQTCIEFANSRQLGIQLNRALQHSSHR